MILTFFNILTTFILPSMSTPWIQKMGRYRYITAVKNSFRVHRYNVSVHHDVTAQQTQSQRNGRCAAVTITETIFLTQEPT